MKKNCSKGYECGKTCITNTKACIIEGLNQTSVVVANKMTGRIREFKAFTLNLDTSKVKPVDKTKSLKDQTQEVANQIKESGFYGKMVVKDNKIIMPDNGVIKITKSGIDTLKINKGLIPLVSKLKGDHQPFTDRKEAEQVHEKTKHNQSTYKEWGIKEPEKTMQAIKDYADESSSLIKQVDAGVLSDKDLKEKANAINDFIDKAPPFNGVIYSGFQADMDSVYQTDRLEVGNKFKFPSITSFSSNEEVATGYAMAGGMFVIRNNKTASSVRGLSEYQSEEEVLTNSKPTYTLKNKYYDEAKFMTVYEIEENDDGSNTFDEQEVTQPIKDQPKEKDRSEHWAPVAPLIIIE